MNLIRDLILPVGIIAAVFWWWLWLQKNKKYYRNLMTPPTVPFFGNVLDITSARELLKTFTRYVKEYGGILRVKIGPIKNVVVVTNYKFTEFILSSNKLLTKSQDYQYLYPWLGTGLLIGSGPKWKKHRKVLTPAFHFQMLGDFIGTFESCGDVLVRKLSKELGKQSVDIYPYVTLCSLDVICESIMGTSINAQDDINSEYVFSVKEMCRIIKKRSTRLFHMHDLTFFFTKNYRTQQKVIRILHEKSNSVIDTRSKKLQSESESVENNDNATKKKKLFLDLLLEAKVDGRPLAREEIREEVDTFMFAGHDTTAAAMSFTLFCLANYPEVQRAAYEEQQSIFDSNNSSEVTYANLQSMKYLEQVIKETLRLYPPVPIYGRNLDEDLEYENICLPKGISVFIFPFAAHRNSTYFENPEDFNPNRFEHLEGKYPYAYLPFSAGPRNCIGQKFAMLEIKSIISKIIRKFELQPATPKHELELVPDTVLKSSNGIKINLKLRS